MASHVALIGKTGFRRNIGQGFASSQQSAGIIKSGHDLICPRRHTVQFFKAAGKTFTAHAGKLRRMTNPLITLDLNSPVRGHFRHIAITALGSNGGDVPPVNTIFTLP